MSSKFPIAKRKSTRKVQPTIDPSVTKAVDNATPLIYALAEKIKSYHDPEPDSTVELSGYEAVIQKLFNTWPADDISKRLAQLTAAITDFTPTVSSTTLEVGQLFKQDGEVFVTVYTSSSGQPYGVNASADRYNYISGPITDGLLNPASIYYVNKAEYGLFTKALLGTSGAKFLSYLASTINGGVQQVTTALGEGVV